MAYVAPSSTTTGDLITAAIWNQDVVDNVIAVKALVDAANPSGAMMLWTTNTAPSNWLLCYGQAVNRTTYSDLFAVIGTTFGVGDGSTTFNLPDMRGRFPLGQDDMGGSSANRVTSANADGIGLSDGAETHTLDTSELAAHTHSVRTKDTGGTQQSLSANASSGMTTSGSTGGDAAHDNMSPYLTLNYIIKT